ncbi:unnamed protein product [Caenorhabditis bovis]|uniref:Cytochrome P450 n=1 Tax=Caenorhabditis bovis TaxID=2654633 RepID=A0A8S1EV18_9PELO|nr:unnamed protein product [Caenorhabditis bovis]
MILSTTITVTALIGIASYYLYNWLYWKLRGIPGPWGYPVIGSFLDTMKVQDSILLKLQTWTKKYGKIYGITEGQTKLLVISEPELVNEVFVKQFDNFYSRRMNKLQVDPENDTRVHVFSARGPRWRRLRAVASLSFSSNNIKNVMPQMDDSAKKLVEILVARLNGNEATDIQLAYKEFTFDNPLSKSAHEFFHNDDWLLFTIIGSFPRFSRFLRYMFTAFPKLFGGTALVNLLRVCDKAVRQRIVQREMDEKNGVENHVHNDFIDTYLDYRADFKTEETGLTNKLDRKLNTDEIIAMSALFLVAGFDTISFTATLVSYCLATHPEAQKKALEEIDRECVSADLTYEQLSNLHYLDFVIRETLRLYPTAASGPSRKCMKATVIGGIPIEEGVEVIADSMSLHYDKTIWGDDADEFKPERWEKEESFMTNPSYVPFGIGKRICIGMRLAYFEIKVLTAHMLRTFTLTTGPETTIPPKLIGREVLGPETTKLYLKLRE